MKTAFTVRVEADFLARVKKASAQAGVSLTTYVIDALSHALESGGHPPELPLVESHVDTTWAMDDPEPPIGRPMVPAPPTQAYLAAKEKLSHAIKTAPKPDLHHPTCPCELCRP